jgi:DNA-binding transcriptional ArsR family regulator
MPSQKPPTLTNPRLAAAMTHPTRLRTMRVLAERTATPRQIAEEIDEPVNNVAYHVNILAKLGCIELIDVRSARGGRVAEHVYRASRRPYFDQSAWEQLGESEKLNVVAAIMHHVTDDVARAMAHGTFYEPDDNHLSRSPMTVDQEGWRETIDLLDETLDRLATIQQRVNERSAGTEETMLAKVAILHFRSPDRESATPS